MLSAPSQPRSQSHRTDSSRDEQTNVPVPQAVRLHRVAGRFDHLVGLQRNIQKQRLGRVIETAHVLLEPKDPAIIKPDAFKDAVAVQQTVIEN